MHNLSRRMHLVLAFSLCIVSAWPVFAQETYDIVIANGRVMDPMPSGTLAFAGRLSLQSHRILYRARRKLTHGVLWFRQGSSICMRTGKVLAPTNSRRWTV